MKFLLPLLFILSSVSYAQSLVNPAFKLENGRFGLDAGLAFSDIEYEGDGGSQADIDRKVLGAAISYGMTPYTDLTGQVAMIFEADLEGEDDQGFMFGGGVRGLVFQNPDIKVFALGEMLYVIESYNDNLDGTHLSLSLEANVRWSVNEYIDLYGGLGLVPFSDGELDGATSTDAKRDDLFNLRIGANFNMGQNFYIRPDVKFVGEQSFGLTAGTSF